MKANITSGNNWITINGLDYERGSISALEEYGNTGVKVYPKNDNPLVITAEGSTGDGESFNDQAELMTFMKQYAPMEEYGAGGQNLNRATIQQVQEGTNNENYVTPYLVHAFVEWFSSELLIIDETYTESPTSAQVNEKYPNARVRTMLYLPNAGSGMKYTKLNATDWESMPYTIA